MLTRGEGQSEERMLPPLLNITLVVTRYSSFLDFIELFRLYTHYLLLSVSEEG